ncbi:MAG: hypothetical protein N2235_02445 [Fischerella sp.]|nr:hypothetical protein [Fischerella sp.]
MALVSPGLEITVTDEAQYIPAAVGTVPLVIVATEENKAVSGGGIAPGTLKENAGRLYGVTSQRELINTFGAPIFKQSAAGTPLHANELNEYGLLAAYSALGISNRAYVLRADVDLKQLESTTVRPKGAVEDGTYWLNLAATDWGIFEWDAETNSFTKQEVMVIVDEDQIYFDNIANTWYPKASVGKIHQYAIVPKSGFNILFHKNLSNVWTVVGYPSWEKSHPTLVGTGANPAVTLGTQILINTVLVTFTGSTITDVKNAINGAAIEGVSAEVSSDGFIQLLVDGTAKSNGMVVDGKLAIYDATPGALEEIGLTSGVYNSPGVYYGAFSDVPPWASFESEPRPTGSIWVKTSVQGGGVDFALSKYSAESNSWIRQAITFVGSAINEFLFQVDPTGGGKNIPVGSIFLRTGFNNVIVRYHTYIKVGESVATGTWSGLPFNVGDQVQIQYTAPGNPNFINAGTVTLTGTTLEDFVHQLQLLNMQYVEIEYTANTITMRHTTDGAIFFRNIVGNAWENAGFTTSTPGVHQIGGFYHIDGFDPLTYVYGFEPPYAKPADGTLWYYGTPTEVDIMYRDTGGWKGYKNVTIDARGYDLSQTDPRGPILSPTAPKTQSDNTALVPGDLWIDTSDLINFPKIYRYNSLNRWVLIDNTDRTSQNGIVFADARWGTSGTVDVVAGDLPSIVELQTSNYVDLDAPDYRLYPRGALLFNLRRSSFNVKKFVSNYFNEDAYPDATLPAVKDAWVTASGLKDNGAPYMGAGAQRAIVVKAMRAAVDGSQEIREETNNFNLIVAPGYPELISNMVALNNDRALEAFVIGDTPMTLKSDIVSLTRWSENVNGEGLATASPYLGVYYPHGLTNDLNGNVVAVPASHMMLRTFIFNDNVSYPWFAPAGTRRGLVDNAVALGYVDNRSGAFIRTNINQGTRDALYETRLNPISSLPGVGITVFGQKTRGITGSSLDRVNVARLVNYIRTILKVIGNQFLFEPNDKITRDQIRAIIDSAMNDLVTKRGIYDYLVVCDESNNTPDRIARNELYVDVAIEPMKAVEYIYIPIRLKNPGAIAQGL